jgi:hypothetical protein
MNLKNALIVLVTIAVLLGIAAVFVVFYNPAISTIPGTPVSSASLFSFMRNSTSTTASGSIPGINAFIGNASSSANNNQSSGPQFASSYSSPYPLQWTEGQSTLAITGAAIQGSQLMLIVTVQMGNDPECIPMNMRLVTDESGDLEAPTPQQFSFPDTNSCNGTPNMVYNTQAVSFALGQNLNAPFLLTTGGASNIFFEVATTTDGGVSLTLPATTD